VPSNAPLLAPRPQPLAVAIHEPPGLVKQSSSGGSSSGGSSIQAHQVQGKARRKRRSIPPPQPIPVPGAPDYSQLAPLPPAHQTHDGPMTSCGSSAASSRPSQQFAPSPYHNLPHPSQMNNQPYSSAPPPNVYGFGNPAPGVQIGPQGPRDFANPSHFRYRPKVLTVPTPLAPHMQGNGWTAPSSTAGSVMMMSPPYQAQQLAASYSLAAAPPHPSASPYQSHWKPYTPEPPPPSQLHQQQQVQPLPLPSSQQHDQQQQGWQRGHQYSRSEPPMIEFPQPSPEGPSPSMQNGYYVDARKASAEMQVNSSPRRGGELLFPSPVPPPVHAKPPPPSQRGHAKSMSESVPAKMSASTVARMLQAQRGNPANASSTSLAQQAQAQSQSQPLAPEVRTNTHRPDSPVNLAPPSNQARRPPAPPHTEAQPSSRPRVLRRETPPPPPPQAASVPILIRSDSPAGLGPSPSQVHSRGFASSDALLEGGNNGNSSSSSNVSVPTPTGRKISFNVPHGPEQDPPAAAAAPKKRRRGRPTNPDDNMLVDPFGFPVVEDTRYDVVEKVAAAVSICLHSFL